MSVRYSTNWDGKVDLARKFNCNTAAREKLNSLKNYLFRFRSNSRDVPPQLPPRDNIYGTVQPSTNQWEEKREKKGGDDPYYFGLSARLVVMSFCLPKYLLFVLKLQDQMISKMCILNICFLYTLCQILTHTENVCQKNDPTCKQTL